MIIQSQPCCPLCLAAETASVATSENPFHELTVCTECGHVFVANEQMDATRNAAVQQAFFGEGFAARSGFFVDYYDGRNVRRTATALQLPSSSRVLEIGPGSGALMGYLKTLGCDVQGLELSKNVATQIERRWHLRVAVETLDAHLGSVGQGSYDAVIMRHVLEHFTEPREALNAIYSLLKPGAVLYLAVPNFDSWHRHFSGWSGYEPYHVQFFGKHPICTVVRGAGFEVCKVGSYESLTGWVNTVARTLGGKVPHTHGGGGNGTSRAGVELLRFALGATLTPLRWLQAVAGKGEELFVLAKRPAA